VTTWQRHPRSLWRRSGDRIVLAPPAVDETVVLEGSGAITWLLLDRPLPFELLVDALVERFSVERHVVEAEVRPFLQTLMELGAAIET
jgi:hypothetical protein